MQVNHSSSDKQSPLRIIELQSEGLNFGDMFFPDGMDNDPELCFHGTSSTREELIDREGLQPNAGGVTHEQARNLVECFDLLGWRGAVGPLRSFTLNDFKKGDRSPLFLSSLPSQVFYFSMLSSAGGEKLSSCRKAIAALRRFLNDANFRDSERTNAENWSRPEAASTMSDALLEEIRAKLSHFTNLERAAQDEFDRYRYAVIYAIRPPAQARATWEKGGMVWRVFDPIPPSWFVAKLRVFQPSKM